MRGGFRILDESKELTRSNIFLLHKLFSICASILAEHLKIKNLIPIHVVFISQDRMRELHGAYYGAHKITDILSFYYEKDHDGIHEYGELFLCTSQVLRQAKKYRASFEHECERLLIHGTLHLYGYDHVKKNERAIMNEITEKILQKIIKKS